jgi:hypothetical protein
MNTAPPTGAALLAFQFPERNAFAVRQRATILLVSRGRRSIGAGMRFSTLLGGHYCSNGIAVTAARVDRAPVWRNLSTLSDLERRRASARASARGVDWRHPVEPSWRSDTSSGVAARAAATRSHLARHELTTVSMRPAVGGGKHRREDLALRPILRGGEVLSITFAKYRSTS